MRAEKGGGPTARATARPVRTALTGFGSNPGALSGWRVVPTRVAGRVPLVVVLHGCTQNAADIDNGAGWSTLAAEAGFALLLVEQARSNNPNLCFNWFQTGDSQREGGEVESIRQMVAALVADGTADPARLFVTGLSAGGAITASLLATAPDVFAGGAIIAGVAHGVAGSITEGLERMRGRGLPDAATIAARARAALSYAGPWPRLSVWHGSADASVAPVNAEAILAGWASLCGLAAPSGAALINGHQRRVWRDAHGVEQIEAHIIAGMGHGLPITSIGPEACGTPGSYFLECGLSSTRRIAAFWGIAPPV
jgi:poly(hydroxyalkanoate) depolymerase family esterase